MVLKTYGDVRERRAFKLAEERYMRAVRVAGVVDRRVGWNSSRARRAWRRVGRRGHPALLAAIMVFQNEHPALEPGGWRKGR